MDPNALRRRAPALHVLARQDGDYRGGWPLGYLGPQCLADAPVVCKRSSDAEPQGCCPQGQYCMTTISEVYCCPTEADCGTAVKNRPICANGAWTLFGLTSNRYFCCPAGFFGVKSVELSGRGICEPNLDGLPLTRIASTISSGNPAATGTAATTRGGSGQTTSPGGSAGGTGVPSDSAGESSGGGSVSAGVIAGSVVGGVVLLLLGIALILWLHRRSLRRDPGPGQGLVPGQAMAETKPDPSPPPHPQPSPSPGTVSPGTAAQSQYQYPSPATAATQHHYQQPPPPPPQFASPALATPPPQYSGAHHAQPPEADGVGRFEMAADR
ncbi:hypothetical protein QBC34DRAFT_75938 [Podospora aff. communis PSN243]|uniref:Uncharacterized protein n=1 Tax=Podospora aff. communis PSN243 TaxID=3040156 RepID=A0AAV9GRD8_9PEZI|nr:hypothetical protein QBC34DRAFT_75938 [Podospora aff. communis PSN243]